MQLSILDRAAKIHQANRQKSDLQLYLDVPQKHIPK
jgi:hypothetical protein